MAQAAALTIADQVPANHTYNPTSASGQRAVFVNSESSTAAGRPSIVVDYQPLAATSTREKVKINTAIPVEQTVDGVVQVHHVNRAVTEFYLDASATLAEKQNLLARHKSILGNAVMTTLVTTGEPPY